MGCGMSRLRVSSRGAPPPNTFRMDILFLSRSEVDYVLADPSQRKGVFLVYEDVDTSNTYLAFKSVSDTVEHHVISRRCELFYVNNFPFPYLEAIVFYYQKHRFNGTLLTEQAFIHPYMTATKRPIRTPQMKRSPSARARHKEASLSSSSEREVYHSVKMA